MEKKKAKIAVLGSANGDIYYFLNHVPKVGETIDASSTSKAPGGKGANQAAASALLSAQTTFLGQVGKDEIGDMLLSELGVRGVDVSKVRVLPDTPSGHALILSQADGDNSIVIVASANAAWPEELYPEYK